MSCVHTPRRIVLMLALLVLAGCSHGDRFLDTQLLPEAGQQTEVYSGSAYQSPNYHPYETGSRITFSGVDTVHIGGDYEPRERLDRIGTGETITGSRFHFFMGPSRDGVGVDRLSNYETDLITKDGTISPILSDDGFFPFRVKPRILFGRGFEDFDTDVFYLLADSVHILNDILPPEFQIKDGGRHRGRWVYEGDILVAALPPAEIQRVCGSGAAACAVNNVSYWGHSRNATVYIPDDLDMTKTSSRSIVVHELLLALGNQGHVYSIEFPDSLMGTSGEFFPNPGFTIHPIDREALQIMYMSQRTETYNDWDEWSDTTLHLMARSEDETVHFGVALANGLPQPWAKGAIPDSILADNRELQGRASWHGTLLGFSGISPIGGKAQLDVTLWRLDRPQDLKFRDIAFLNRSDDADAWFPTRNLDYKVDIYGNGLFHSSDKGHVVGSFLGAQHESMAGTIKRTDLVGAFGGTR